MAGIEAEYITISGKKKVKRVEAGEQFDLGRQRDELAYVKLIGIERGGVAVPRNNWDGGPGQPLVLKPGEIKELYFHPWRGVLDEEPGQDKELKVKLTGF